jgi:hypothetical protein
MLKIKIKSKKKKKKQAEKILLSLKSCSLFVVASPLPASGPQHSPPYKVKQQT